jgi:hypothetical protein
MESRNPISYGSGGDELKYGFEPEVRSPPPSFHTGSDDDEEKEN